MSGYSEDKSICPFCSKGVQSEGIMSSNNFIAIYNIAPILPGHTLVVPKKHISSLFGLSAEETKEMILIAKKLTKVLLSVFGGKGFDWSVQEGECAGQSIPHLHLHIIVRKPGDLPAGKDWYQKVRQHESAILDSNHRKRLSRQEYIYFTELIKNEFERIKATLEEE